MTRFLRVVGLVAVCCAPTVDSFAQPANLQVLISRADTVQRRATAQSATISRLLDEARRAKNGLRVNCLNRKLTETNANARILGQRMKLLREAVAGNDANRAQHQSAVFDAVSRKLTEISQEAAQCIGQDNLDGGGSQVVTTVPADSPKGDATAIPGDTPIPPSVTVPPVFSPKLNSKM